MLVSCFPLSLAVGRIQLRSFSFSPLSLSLSFSSLFSWSINVMIMDFFFAREEWDMERNYLAVKKFGSRGFEFTLLGLDRFFR